jgi:hypothetical protein
MKEDTKKAEAKQNELCRMRGGWCRDCESSEYKPECMEKAEARNAEAIKEKYMEYVHQTQGIDVWEEGAFREGWREGIKYASLREAQAWISVKDRLPESTNPVLGGCAGFKGLFICVYTKGHEIEYGDEDYDGPYDEIEDKNGTLYLKPGWYELEEQIQSQYDEAWLNRHITHWQPLPQPPDHENR